MLCQLIQPFRPSSNVGRKAKDTELMLRIYCLQQWYNLSDLATEEAICDRFSFQQFLKIDSFSDSATDETTILNFRHLLESNKLLRNYFKKINEYLENQGLLMKMGTIVKETIILAPSSTKNKARKRCPEMIKLVKIISSISA